MASGVEPISCINNARAVRVLRLAMSAEEKLHYKKKEEHDGGKGQQQLTTNQPNSTNISEESIIKISYKYQFVSPPPDDVICPLCLDIVEEPHQFTCCGHHICKKCGDKLKQQATTPHCPMCRHNEYGTVYDKYFERNVLNKLTIWCTKGCGQKVELGQLKNHLPQCPCVQEDCPYECGQQQQRQYIEEHKEKCPKRPFICGYCKYQSTYEVIVNEHYPVCDKYPIICPNECSGDEIERGMLQDHIDKCPYQVVECEFSHVGCQEKVCRCDLSQHLSDNGIHHSALSSKMIYESLQKMMEEKDRQLHEKDRQLAKKDEVVIEKDRQLQEKEAQIAMKDGELKEVIQQLQEKDKQLQTRNKQLREKDKKLDELSKKLEGLECVVTNIHDRICVNIVPLYVTMTEFKHKMDNKVHWFSPPYFTHVNGYKMCFEVRNGTSIDIYSHMMKGPYDDLLSWPFKGKVIVRLLNQCGDHHHYDYVFDYNYGDRGKRITGGELGDLLGGYVAHLRFDQLGHNAAINCQYLKDDCFKFIVMVPTSR